jgi:hypothetical protein
MIRAGLARWLQGPVLTGWAALLCAVVAIGLPTLVRAAVNDVVSGCEFTPYVPFVFVCAIMLRWWQAGAVALASAATLGLVFDGPPKQLLASQCYISSAGTFLLSSAAMIGIAMLVRRTIAALQIHNTEDSSGGIVFSLEKGEVWASWYGQGQPVRLGTQTRVSEMMEDFLAQVEVGKRLSRPR